MGRPILPETGKPFPRKRPMNWAWVRKMLTARRQDRKLRDAGFEGPFELPIWEIYRGGRIGEYAVAVELGTDGRSVYFKMVEPA